MQRIALVAATALVAAFAQGAYAADMSVTPFFRGSPVVIGYNWQGYYVGANIGWSRASSDISWSPNPTGFLTVAPGGTLLSDVGPISSASKNTLTSNGAAGGIQTGYNWQWGNVVAGIEGDVTFMRNNATLSVAPLPLPAASGSNLSQSARLDWLVTVRPRLGYAWDNWLLYVTGGWAMGKVVFSDALVPSDGGFLGTTMSRELNGWTVGAGVEYGLVSGWTLKAEYLYTDLGSAAVLMGPSITNAGLNVVGTNHTMTDQIARIGFNFRFGGEHETVVKYP
jgi:outer membrane immunogenic protein